MKLYDRSRVATDWRCRRRRYWNYEHNGTGIVSGNAAYELYVGILIHDAMAAIATTHQSGVVPIDTIAEAGRNQLVEAIRAQGNDVDEYAQEQGALVEGMIRGFYRFAWPRLLDLYPTIVVIEQEVVTDYGFMVKPDLILQSEDGSLVYIEYKSTGTKNEKWIESWKSAPQIHGYVKAIKDATGLDITAAHVVGLYKGYESYGRQNSPFCYAHARGAQPPFFDQELLYSYKAGYKKTPAWELPGGVKSWVAGMPQSVLEEQFVFVPPVFYDANIAEAFFRQSQIRENEIAQGMSLLKLVKGEEDRQAIMDGWFQQNFEGCRPGWGSHCPYASICIDRGDPNDSKWQPREPHHSSEILPTSSDYKG